MTPTHAVTFSALLSPEGRHSFGTDLNPRDSQVAMATSNKNSCLWAPTLCRALHTSKVVHEVFFEMKASMTLFFRAMEKGIRGPAEV